MLYTTLISAVVLVILILLQVREGGLSLALTGTIQAPIERRGGVKTIHVTTIIVALIFIGSCIASFLL